MKKVWSLMLAVMLASTVGYGATYYWTGSTDTQYSTANNWSPVRSVALNSDTLMFQADSTVRDTVTLIPTQTVSFVKITPSTGIIVQTASGKQTLSISDSLVIGSGASLTVNSPTSAADTLVIYLNAGARASIYGSIAFNYFGTTTGPRHRLDAADSLAIQFTNGSSLIQNSVGNIFGASAGNNRVVFNSGSQFIQYLGSNPFGVSTPGSKVLFKPGSWFRSRMSGTPSFSGRTYANFELNYQATVTGTGTSPVTIDTLLVTDGHLNLQLRHINLKGAMIVHDTLYFNSATTCSLYFNGSTQQTMDWSTANSFMLGSTANVFVDNPAGLSLNSNMTVNCKLHLTNGNIVTGPNEVLLTTDSTVVRGNGYVQGTLWRIINTGTGVVKDYPVGNDAGYTPASLTFANVTATGGAAVTVVHNTHPGVNIAANTLQNYWTVSPTGGLAFDACDAVLKYLSSDFNAGFTEADDESLMLAGKYDGSWTFPVTGVRDTVNNTIQLTGLTGFSDFTMGKDSSSFIIPPDTTPPAITGTSPVTGATGVALDAPIYIAFSEPMDTTTLAGSVTPSPNEQTSWNATLDTLTLTHDPMEVSTAYTIMLTSIKDLAGNDLAVLPDSIVFTTLADTTHPLIVWTSPANGDTKVAPGAPVIVAFSEPIDTSSFAGTVDPFVNGLNPVWNAGGDTLALVHTVEDFALGTVYTVKVTAANDIYGIPLAVLPDSIMFTTKADTTAPHIVFTSPADGDSNVPRNQPVKLAFSEPIDQASFNGYSMPDCNFNPSWNATFDTLTLTPDTLYWYSTTITMSCTTGTDTSGNRIADLPVSFAFTTVDNEVPLIEVVQQPVSTFDGAGPFNIAAVLTDPSKKSKAGVVSNQLYWQSSNDTLWNSVAATAVSGDTFGYVIPGPLAAGLTINAYVEAIDDAGATRYSDLIQFQILAPLAPSGLAATGGMDLSVPLSWNPPAESLYYYIPTSLVYAFNMPAGTIASTRYTPSQYPCKISQIRSSWNTTYGTSAVHFRIYGDDGQGFPDEGNVIFDSTYTPAAGTWADLLDLSAYNLVVSSGDFHVSWEVLTYQQPRPRGTQDGGIQQRSLYKWTDGFWYADLGGDWLNRVAVSYANYTTGLALKKAPADGNDPRLTRANPNAPQPTKDVCLKQSEDLPAFDLVKNIGDYQVYRSTGSGGPYSFVASTTGLTYDDNSVANDTTYYYVVRATYTWTSHPDTFSAWSNEASATPTGVEGQPGVQGHCFYLMPASPNPVRQSAEFRFGLNREAYASLEIYNVLGQRVKVLLSGKLAAGDHSAKWNGCDDNGRKVSSGVYVYRLKAGDKASTRRFTVIR